MLDESAIAEIDPTDVPNLLVSEEAPSGLGKFSLWEGSNCIGGLELDVKNKTFSRTPTPYIFHVFSEDYVDENIRNKLEVLNGEISHEIIVGKDNAELDSKETERRNKNREQIAKRDVINIRFQEGKLKLQSDFAIRASLGSFQKLNPEVYSEVTSFSDGKSVAELLNQYNTFKSMPSDPVLPQGVGIEPLSLDISKIESALARITSPSSISEAYKERIRRDQNFIYAGLTHYEANKSECPFCTQSMSDIAIAAVSAYSDYFNDMEATERTSLKRLIADIERAERVIEKWEKDCLRSKSHFDNLKVYFPSFKEEVVNDISTPNESLSQYLNALRGALSQKLENLAVSIDTPDGKLDLLISQIENICASNSEIFSKLETTINNSTEERKSIQNSACKAYERDFFVSNKRELDEIHSISSDISALTEEIEEIKKTHGAKASARERVVETFSLMLSRLFGDKYSFDGSTFKIQRNKKEMLRGGDRTLSDGEKSVLAFCYFIAQTHLRVETVDDYMRVFFVFDDPVTSMSFDYIYSIIQSLKYFRIKDGGIIHFGLDASSHRPKMLVLTHNNYFYNIAHTNNFIKKRNLFQLVAGSREHQLSSQGAFATPHLLQLKDVYDVAKAVITPDYRTPNSIRSVIEGMWRFCRPDLNDLGDFIRHLIEDHGIEVKSVLINDLSHGGKFDEQPHKQEDIVIAASEAIAVVEIFAQGQLKRL
ncbi:hypothetical protein PhaeoP13_01708 [Phaeobacter piscinae]|uniref:Protein CR006 P-loop domain-containing protein n=2 Tax=Phaeobacter piscinae TaxID=1580596 RepID=A0AAN1GRG8_9RHOB|nr:hypothetical protein PhaeoP13_01708 [Phaeobacter piscinae]